MVTNFIERQKSIKAKASSETDEMSAKNRFSGGPKNKDLAKLPNDNRRHSILQISTFGMFDDENENRFIEWYKNLTLEKILDSFVIHPKQSKFYNVWVFYLSTVSIIQSVIYSILIAYDPSPSIMPSLVSMLVIIESSYMFQIFIECSKAYDVQGDGIYEMRWKKIFWRFIKTN